MIYQCIRQMLQTTRMLKCCDFYTSSGSWVAKRTLAPQSPWNGGASCIKMKKKGKRKVITQTVSHITLLWAVNERI